MGVTMLASRQQTAWEPSYFPHADRPQALPSVSGTAERAAMSPAMLAIGLFIVLALASAVQAVLYPELLSDIFARL